MKTREIILGILLCLVAKVLGFPISGSPLQVYVLGEAVGLLARVLYKCRVEFFQRHAKRVLDRFGVGAAFGVTLQNGKNFREAVFRYDELADQPALVISEDHLSRELRMR